LTLDADELYEITGYRIPSKQFEVLQRMGLPAFLRPDGSVSLGRTHYQQWLVKKPEEVKRPRPELRLIPKRIRNAKTP
jgi:hypothetical protein